VSTASSENYYQLLGLDRHASVDQIKEAYRDIAKLYHPDSNFYDEIINEPLPTDALERFKQITAAYTTLVHEGKRAAYDNTLPPELQGWDSEEEELAPRTRTKPGADLDDDDDDEEEEDDDDDQFRPMRSEPTTMFTARGEIRDRAFDPNSEDGDRVGARRKGKKGASVVEGVLLSWYAALGTGVLIGSILGAITLRLLGYL
jgi:DnaJ-class molecular chaperone